LAKNEKSRYYCPLIVDERTRARARRDAHIGSAGVWNVAGCIAMAMNESLKIPLLTPND
jgi:hypothetical protein